MSIHLPDLPCFFHPEKLGAKEMISLSDDESHHAIHVMRLKDGCNVLISNGKGTIASGKLLQRSKKLVEVSIHEILVQTEAPIFQTSLLLGMIGQPSRMEWVIEKSIEIGVDQIFLCQTNRSKSGHLNLGRLQKIAVAALKQSRKAFLPPISALSFNELGSLTGFASKLIATASVDNAQSIKQHLQVNVNTLIAIGPEGDFTTDEIKLAVDLGFVPCLLGNERLRSETAALYALVSASSR